MSKKGIKLNILIIIIILCMLFLSSCENMITFSGTCVSIGKKFELDFKLLNTTYESWMTLDKADKVKTSFEITEGSVDIYVRHEDNSIIYQGNDVKNGDFILEISKSGKYHFEVIGSNAAGYVHFNKIP